GQSLGRTKGSIMSRLSHWGLVGPDTYISGLFQGYRAGEVAVEDSRGGITRMGVRYSQNAIQEAVSLGIDPYSVPANQGNAVTVREVRSYAASLPPTQAPAAAPVQPLPATTPSQLPLPFP